MIYLSGIINSDELSRHLSSRKAVEETLRQGRYHLTTLRAGIIVGSGSASFEIIRDLVDSMKVEVVCSYNDLDKILGIDLITYKEAVRRAFDLIENREIISSWTDALSGNLLSDGMVLRELVMEHQGFHRQNGGRSWIKARQEG